MEKIISEDALKKANNIEKCQILLKDRLGIVKDKNVRRDNKIWIK